MSSSLSPLVFICFPHPGGSFVHNEKEIGSGGRGFDGEIRCLTPYTQFKGVLCNISIAMNFSDAWHLHLLQLGFSTKLHLNCLHLTRVCGLCHHPPLSNSGNVSGHHLAGSNKTGCWSSFVSFVASFSSVQFCHFCHLSSYSRWLCPLIYTWNSIMLSSPSSTSCGLIDHRAFFTDSTKRPSLILQIVLSSLILQNVLRGWRCHHSCRYLNRTECSWSRQLKSWLESWSRTRSAKFMTRSYCVLSNWCLSERCIRVDPLNLSCLNLIDVAFITL